RAATDHSQGTSARNCTQCGNTETESFYPEGTVLRGGSNDPALVKDLQQMLVDQKYLQDTVDGIFGKNTEAAVKAFQAEHRLMEDGIGWPQTIQAVRSAANGEAIYETSSQPEQFDFYRDEAVYTLSQFRDIIKQQNELCAIAYLGAYEAEYPYLPTYLEVAGVSQKFPFFLEIPEEHFLTYEGSQLYCIVPAEKDALVTVNPWLLTEENDYLGEAGEAIYEGDSGDPIFVRGNVSDIMPNLQILIEDTDGRSVEYYPFMSLKDNMLELPNGGGVLDFTPYGSKLLSEYQGYDEETEKMDPGAPDTAIKGEDPGTLIGDWTADGVYTQMGEEYDGTLTFYGDSTLAFGSGKSREPYENYYTGRWTYREQGKEGSEYSGIVEMELTRTAESTAETKERIAGTYIILRYGEELISITRLEGEDLFPDQYWNDIRFTYAVG
ncbi:MAG: peptidoglycan-binding domain-containing protein, partial [Eubacteriales bacterium]|nr:peptidoglycan-binding domain-containing protein [Eubacteriales bacterium]